MRNFTLLVCLGATALLGQMPSPMPPFPVFPADLQKYLDLSNAQVDTIRRANTELDIFRARKQMRIAQVQREIRDFTALDPVDPMQLGVRYAEVEGINREIRDEEKKTTVAVRGVLNPAQLAKLKVLEDAVKLQPLIGSAVCENLLTPAATAAMPVPMGVVGIPAMPGAAVNAAFGCLRAVLMPAPLP